jgi:drug/metabolite transporter (DMT)-like permease
MESFVFAAVLFGAACHASWNAVIKVGLDPFLTTILVAVAAGLVALPFVPFVGLPVAAAWPWVIASILIHLAYFIGLIGAYRSGDMGQVYPLARGSAPLMTAILSAVLIGEWLSPAGWIGVVVLVAGVFLLSARGGRELVHLNRRAVGFALFTAVTICAYSLVDGIGARVSGNAHAYSVALFVGNAVIMAAYGLALRGGGVVADMLRYWQRGLAGGALQLASYWIAIWAMTLAPIAIVAALRETSVLFGALIAVVVLKEPLRPVRIVAAVAIMIGLALIRLS